MGAFSYQALNKAGKDIKGVITADSARHARELLKNDNLIPVNVNQLENNSIQTKNKNKISSQDLALFTRQLATLINAGIPLEESLRGVAEQTDKEKVRDLIIGVRAKVVEGYSLAKALDDYPKTFSKVFCATVSSGEHTGNLGLVLEKLADYTERQQETKQKITQSLIYPTLMVLISSSIISFLLAFVVPKIIDVFTSSGQTLPAMTSILLNISNFVKNYIIYIIISVIIVLFILKKLLQKDKFRYSWDKTMLRLPLVGFLVRSVNVSRYIHTFSILFAAGVSVLETMKVSTSLIKNTFMQEKFNNAQIAVKEGASISQALKNTKQLNSLAIHLIASGEKSGTLAPMMEKAANYMENEVNRLIDTFLSLLEPLIILFMGGIVLFIVLATLLPIFSMEQLVL